MANNRYITGDIAAINAPKKAAKVPMVQAVEPVKGDWSQNNNWAFTLNRSSGWPLQNPPTILGVAQNLTFRGPPRARGITLTREDFFISLGAGSGNITIKARITYGVGGISQQMLVDWGSGVVINLIASSISVEVIVEGQNDNAGQPILGSKLGVLFSNELLPKTGYTTLTTRSLNIALNDILIPAFACGFMVGNETVPVATFLRGYSSGYPGNAIITWNEVFTEDNGGAIWWLPSDTQYISGSAAGAAFFHWILNV